MVKIPPITESTQIPETIIYEYDEENILNLKAIYVNGNTVIYRFGKQIYLHIEYEGFYYNGYYEDSIHQEYDAINACWGEVRDYSGEREQYGVFLINRA